MLTSTIINGLAGAIALDGLRLGATIYGFAVAAAAIGEVVAAILQIIEKIH